MSQELLAMSSAPLRQAIQDVEDAAAQSSQAHHRLFQLFTKAQALFTSEHPDNDFDELLTEKARNSITVSRQFYNRLAPVRSALLESQWSLGEDLCESTFGSKAAESRRFLDALRKLQLAKMSWDTAVRLIQQEQHNRVHTKSTNPGVLRHDRPIPRDVESALKTFRKENTQRVKAADGSATVVESNTQGRKRQMTERSPVKELETRKSKRKVSSPERASQSQEPLKLTVFMDEKMQVKACEEADTQTGKEAQNTKFNDLEGALNLPESSVTMRRKHVASKSTDSFKLPYPAGPPPQIPLGRNSVSRLRSRSISISSHIPGPLLLSPITEESSFAKSQASTPGIETGRDAPRRLSDAEDSLVHSVEKAYCEEVSNDEHDDGIDYSNDSDSGNENDNHHDHETGESVECNEVNVVNRDGMDYTLGALSPASMSSSPGPTSSPLKLLEMVVPVGGLNAHPNNDENLVDLTHEGHSPDGSPLRGERGGNSAKVPQSHPDTTVAGALQTLRPGGWLSASALGLVLTHFPRSYALCLDPSYITVGRDDLILEKRLRVDDAVEIVVVPLFYQSHWTIGVLDLKSGLVKHYDSLSGRSKPAEAQLSSLRVFCNWLKHLFPRLTQTTWTINHVQCAQQANYIDCGIYALVNCLAALEGRPLPVTIDGELWRSVFAAMLGIKAPTNYLNEDHPDRRDNVSPKVYYQAVITRAKVVRDDQLLYSAAMTTTLDHVTARTAVYEVEIGERRTVITQLESFGGNYGDAIAKLRREIQVKENKLDPSFRTGLQAGLRVLEQAREHAEIQLSMVRDEIDEKVSAATREVAELSKLRDDASV